jgi:pyruvate/2-oxoglutarate dehydrogenase complex dihydrolipoamide dehydrogenase (E3) component
MSVAGETMSYPGASHDAEWRSLVFPRDYVNPRATDRYHLIVIGAGPAGLICALGAAGLGARVALIEHHAMGGDCLNVGCVPSKSLLEFTHRYGPAASFDAAFERMRSVRASVARHDSVERYTQLGVDVFLGDAQFLDADTLKVGNQQLHGRRIVIATGARAGMPAIDGLHDSAPLTNESVFELRRAPQSIAIIGAGAIGCELAQAFSRMGIEVILLDAAERVLSLESPRASAVALDALVRDGVKTELGARISSVERSGADAVISTDNGEFRAEHVVVACGRRANVETLNLDVAGVELTDAGLIRVDSRLRTTNAKIYAAGDVCSTLQFTHHADAQARVVIQNALFAPTARANRLVVPHSTYMIPEIAQVGATQASLDQANVDYLCYELDFAELDRCRAAGSAGEFAEVLIEPSKGKILGATVVAENGGELIVPICVAMTNDLSLSELGKTVFPYPTRSEYLRRIADQHNRTRLTPTVAKIMKSWLKLIG